MVSSSYDVTLNVTDAKTALSAGARALGVTPVGTYKFGWHAKTIGCRVLGHSREEWLRVRARDPKRPPDKLWTGEEDAARLANIAKPGFLAKYDWSAGDRAWRAELMTFITTPVCSPTPEIRDLRHLPEEWLPDLRRSLEHL